MPLRENSMSDYKKDLSNESTVVMNAGEIDEQIRLMREKAISEIQNAEKDGFVIPPDDYDMTIAESVSASEVDELPVPEDDEQIIEPEEEAEEEEFDSADEKAKHKKKVRILVACAIVAAILIGVLVAIIVAKNAHKKAEYEQSFEKAQSYYYDEQYDDALEALRRAMGVEKTDECLLLMSECYEAKNDYVNALAILDSSSSGDVKIKERIRELKKAQAAYEKGNTVIIDYEEYPVDTTSLDLSGKGLKSSELSELSKLTELTSLKLSNNKITDLGFLKPLKKLVSLDLSRNKIEEIDSLSRLTSLKTLHLDGNQISDFEPLYKLTKLTTLTISGMKIGEKQLKELKEALPNCMITSDEAEKDVEDITIGGKTFKSNVKELDLSKCGVSDITALSACTELESINLSGNYISNIAVLMDMPKLKSVNLSRNSISDIRPLMSLTTIEYLDLSGNKVSSVAALGELTALANLNLSGNQIKDFAPISKLVLLSSLNLSGCGMTDASLENLYKLKELDKLNIEDNDISVSAYNKLQSALPKCSISHSEFEKIVLGKKSFEPDAKVVDASNLGLRDISAVEGFVCVERMDLSNNNIGDLAPLFGLKTLKELDLSGNNLNDEQKTAITTELPNCKVYFE